MKEDRYQIREVGKKAKDWVLALEGEYRQAFEGSTNHIVKFQPTQDPIPKHKVGLQSI